MSALVLIASFMTGFLLLTRLFGGTAWLVAYVLLALVAATVLGRRVSFRRGLVGGAAILTVGLAGYLLLLPPAFYGLFTPGRIVSDLAGWVSGRSAVLMLEADLWAVSVAPAPTFLTWYLAVRRRYDAAALVGGATLGFFVLTGDASRATTMVGMAAVLGTLGFGAIQTSDGDWRQFEEVGLVVGLAILVGSLGGLARVVPARGVVGGGAARSTESLEATVIGDRDRLRVRGSISLSPEPRYSVQADRAAYWHVNSFDLYTGNGWRRTNENVDSAAPLAPPPGETEVLKQSFVAESAAERMPFAWKPVLLGSAANRLGSVDRIGEVDTGTTLQPGDQYTLVSAVSTWNETTLRDAGETYPDDVEQRYLQLPEDLPDRLGEEAESITADAETPYETAVAVQTWLTENKDYSLQVDRPDWDVADAFVFAMERGYCVYFATAMTVLLRTQGIPARFVAGYAPGESIDDDRWLLRGFHSHTWVEVYFPDVGWVPFDPTPASDRQAARQERMEASSAEDGPEVAPSGGNDDPTPTPTATATPTAESTATRATASGNASSSQDSRRALERQRQPDRYAQTPTQGHPQAVRSGARGATPTPTPSAGDDAEATRRSGRLWLLGAVATLAFGSVRLGVAQSAVRSVWKRWQPRTDSPETDVERALDRLEYHVTEAFRERREGETRAQFFRAAEAETRVVDTRAWRVLDVYYQQRYGDGVDREAADDAIRLVDELVRN